MTADQKIRIIMQAIDEQAVSIPGYMEEDYIKAIRGALAKIDRQERREGAGCR